MKNKLRRKLIYKAAVRFKSLLPDFRVSFFIITCLRFLYMNQGTHDERYIRPDHQKTEI